MDSTIRGHAACGAYTMTTHDTPHNKALELADRIANDENEHLPVSRSEIATLLRSQASDLAEARAEIEVLKSDAKNVSTLLAVINMQLGNGHIPYEIEDAYADYESATKGEPS
jgi:hypothetical protein